MEHACAYISRLLLPAERNYSTGDRELLAIVWAVEKWRLLLLERHFIIMTDHMALSFLMTQKNLSGRLARQAMLLQSYSFTIRHRPGAANANADGLSRLRFMPDEASICMAVILGNEVESGGGSPQLENCWSDVALEALPVNRPTQALRDTGNSVLAFTRGQLGIVEVGEAGQRLETLGGGSQCLVVTRKGSSRFPQTVQQLEAVGRAVVVVPQPEQQMGAVGRAAVVVSQPLHSMGGQGPSPAPSVGRVVVAGGPQAAQQMGGQDLFPARSAGRTVVVEPQTVQQMGGQGLSPAPSVGRAAAVVPQPAQQMGG